MLQILIMSLMDAGTNQEVNDIVNENLQVLNDNPRLFTFVKNARRRINMIRRAQKKYWPKYELN
jgi:hypothetical protein